MHTSAFEPCIPTRGTTVPAGRDWIHEIKHDGYRLIVQRDGRRVRLWTRNGQPGGSRLFRRFRRLAAQQPFEPARAGSRELLVLTGNLAEIEQWRLTLTPTQHSGCG